jgi:Flp pilus assembly protein TadD
VEPANPAWSASLGESQARLGDLVSALSSFERATQLAANDPGYWRLLATFCMEYNVQISETGLPAAERAVKLAPEDPLALDTLGWIQLGAGQPGTAKQTLLGALERNPNSALAHLHLAMVYLQTGERQEAYQNLKQVLELDPSGTAGQQATGLLKQYFP